MTQVVMRVGKCLYIASPARGNELYQLTRHLISWYAEIGIPINEVIVK